MERQAHLWEQPNFCWEAPELEEGAWQDTFTCQQEVCLYPPACNEGFPTTQIHFLILNLRQILLPFASSLGLYQFCRGNISPEGRNDSQTIVCSSSICSPLA